MNRALILTGGEGHRLRPLTCSTPKAMLPVCGTPLISYTLDTLRRQGFDPILIAADRLSDVITEHLDGFTGLDFIISKAPEGTCPPLSKAAAEAEADDDITVISGGLLFETDLNAAYAAHRKSKADITVITTVTDDPSENVLAAVSDGLVTDIIPHPARTGCISELAVTGIIIVSAAAAEKAALYGDILTEFIPALIRQGGKVQNFTAMGTFISVNTPEDLFAASNAVMEGKIPDIKGHIIRKREERPELEISVPAYIAESADIAPHAVIGRGTVIGENVTVCRGAKLNGAIVMDGAFIGERVTVNGGIIGFGARLLSGASVFEGAVVGDGAVISEQAAVQCGVRIWNGKRVDSYAHASENIKYGSLTPVRIGEDGICGETGSLFTPQAAALAGSSLASLAPSGGRIGIAYKDDPASKSLALAVASGVTAAGADAWIFGAASAPALEYCTAVSGLTAGCRIDGGVTAKISFCSGDGLPLSREEEKVIEEGINRGEYKRAAFNCFGQFRSSSAIVNLYKNMLESSAPSALKGLRAVLNTPGSSVNEVCGGIFDKISDKEGSPIVFHISSDGRRTSAYTEETGYVFDEKLILLCCTERFEQGLDIALPYDFPKAADRLAEKYGRKVFRYSLCPSDKTDKKNPKARKLAMETPFVRDGAALALTTLKILSRSGKSLAQALSELPKSAVVTRFAAVENLSVRRLRQLYGESCCLSEESGDGIVINDKRGRILIRPVKSRKGIIIKAESYSMEAASELCDLGAVAVQRRGATAGKLSFGQSSSSEVNNN